MAVKSCSNVLFPIIIINHICLKDKTSKTLRSAAGLAPTMHTNPHDYEMHLLFLE